ncbi:MAG: sigma-70 family RNA polymerase sigma factor [Myxococcota bacterium]|nr:sigma-70 family RNA polymerase sigma factor [Myxococcota bacterium]
MNRSAEIEHERSRLFGLCYRMLGCAADAEDVVQETFVRAYSSAPHDDAPLRPWLVRVATNLCIDALRARKRRGAYFGPWLPGAVEDLALEGFAGPDARLESVQSAQVALLMALESLDPRARAVLVLRDAMGASAAEVADVLGITEGNVRVILLRARRAIEDAEQPTRALDEASDRLRRLLFAIAAGDLSSVASLLREDAVLTTDANREATAAVRAIRGRDAIVAFQRTVHALHIPTAMWEVVANGGPAIAVEYAPCERLPTRALVRAVFAPDGRVSQLHVLIASRKVHRFHAQVPRQG